MFKTDFKGMNFSNESLPSQNTLRKLTSEEDVQYIHERVEVLSVFNCNGGDQNKCVPRKMKYKNRVITFSELGFRHPTSQGNRMIHVFDMTDGNAEYRIELDAESLTWELVCIIPVS